MSLTVIITRDVEHRYRGFLASVMLELAPGVYASPRLDRGGRERVWEVLSGWHGALGRGSVVMVWRARGEAGGVGLRLLGEPPREIVEIDGFLLTRRGS